MSEQSTTPDLVELTRRFFEAANRRDFGAVLSIFAANAVWETPPLGTSFEGVAIRGFFEDWTAAYDEHKFEPEEILDLGNEVVFAVVDQDARLVGSTGRIRTRGAVFIFEWVEQMIVRVTVYYDIEEARAAAERLAESRG
jgi:ketosteroid isomerase-like protein